MQRDHQEIVHEADERGVRNRGREPLQRVGLNARQQHRLLKEAKIEVAQGNGENGSLGDPPSLRIVLAMYPNKMRRQSETHCVHDVIPRVELRGDVAANEGSVVGLVGIEKGKEIARERDENGAPLPMHGRLKRVFIVLENAVVGLRQTLVHDVQQESHLNGVEALRHVHAHHELLLRAPLFLDQAESLVGVVGTNQLESVHHLHLLLVADRLQNGEGGLESTSALAMRQSRRTQPHGTHVGDGTHAAEGPLVRIHFRDKPQIGDSRVASLLRVSSAREPRRHSALGGREGNNCRTPSRRGQSRNRRVSDRREGSDTRRWCP